MPTAFGKYTLLRKLGEGGMAEVFLAHQPPRNDGGGDDRLCVVKRILPHLNDEPRFVRMFVNEARIAARLRHDAVARIYDLGRVGPAHFMALEYVHGEDLAHVAKRADRAGLAPIPLDAAAKIVIDVCGGLGAAHTATDQEGRPLGIVHRDVSPQNVMVTFDGRIKVIDFGVAKATALAGETRAGMMKGKYAYMSPEQVRGEKVDARADVFAVGIMLYELVAWRRLFKRDADWLTMRAVVEDPVPPASTFRPEGGADLDAILARALDRDRERRYPSCAALAEDLVDLAERRRWDTSRRRLGRLMSELFAERLAQQRNALAQAQARSVEDFLLNSDESTRLEWMPSGGEEEPDDGATVASGAAARPGRPSGVGRRVSGVHVAASGVHVAASGGAAGASGARRFALPAPEKTAVATPEATPTPSLTPSVTGARAKGSLFPLLATILVLTAGAAAGYLLMTRVRSGNGSAGADDQVLAPRPSVFSRNEPPSPSPVSPPRLLLRGQPDVLVFLDGRRRGTTPLTIDDVPFDRPHAITLMKDGFRDGKLDLAPFTGEHAVHVSLEPLDR